jgi:hypothetical protein
MCWTKTIAAFCRSVLLWRPIPLASQTAVVISGCNKSYVSKSLRDSDRDVNSKLETIYAVKFNSDFYIHFEFSIA